MVRFSYCLTPTYPAKDAIKFIKTADELGYYAAYGIDEISTTRTSGCCSPRRPVKPARSGSDRTSPT